jgi:hypothetical protein
MGNFDLCNIYEKFMPHPDNTRHIYFNNTKKCNYENAVAKMLHNRARTDTPKSLENKRKLQLEQYRPSRWGEKSTLCKITGMSEEPSPLHGKLLNSSSPQGNRLESISEMIRINILEEKYSNWSAYSGSKSEISRSLDTIDRVLVGLQSGRSIKKSDFRACEYDIHDQKTEMEDQVFSLSDHGFEATEISPHQLGKKSALGLNLKTNNVNHILIRKVEHKAKLDLMRTQTGKIPLQRLDITDSVENSIVSPRQMTTQRQS